MKFRCVEFLGVRFYEGSVEDIYALHSEVRGLMVVPSGPGLALPMDRVKYFDALRGSDIAIFDSGYFCLLLLLFKGIRVNKLSGLRYLETFLPRMAKSGETLFTVDPSSDQRDQTFYFLRNSGVNVVEQHHIAPFYDPENIDDEDLIKKILRVRPDRIMLNIGGGTQEPLGAYIMDKCSGVDYRPSILCTGAAIAFMSGSQANIPRYVDKIYMGWLARVFHQPRVFIPRYIKALKLFSRVLFKPAKVRTIHV